MLPVEHQIGLFLYLALNARKQLAWEERVAKRLTDIGHWGLGAGEQFAVRIDGTRKALGEPVEGDIRKNGVERWVVVTPFEQFFADPVES